MFNLKQLQNSMSKLQKEVKWIPLQDLRMSIESFRTFLVNSLHVEVNKPSLRNRRIILYTTKPRAYPSNHYYELSFGRYLWNI
jgi:hypothetical protein